MDGPTGAFLPGETYRVTDPIENLQLCVTLRKRATEGERRLAGDSGDSAAKERKRRLRRLGRPSAGSDDEQEAASDGDEDSAQAGESESQPLRVEKEEEEQLLCPPRTFRWQEKAFGREEVKQIRAADSNAAGRRRRGSLFGVELGGAAAAVVDMPNHLRAEFDRLDRSSREAGDGEYRGETIYSRVHSEQYTDLQEWAARYTDSDAEMVTPLARSVLAGSFIRQHRDMLGEAACITMHVFATLPADSDDGARTRRLSASRLSAANLLTALTPGRSDAEAPLEVTLCALRLYPGGRLDVRPPLSTGPSPRLGDPDYGSAQLARWYAIPGTRYEYKLENVSESLAAAAVRAAGSRSRDVLGAFLACTSTCMHVCRHACV